jgi:hypothetical protein
MFFNLKTQNYNGFSKILYLNLLTMILQKKNRKNDK